MNGTLTQYRLDDRGREIGEYYASGNVLRILVYDPFQTAPVVALDPSGNDSYYEVDRIGSVVATSSGSSLVNTYAYLPYGDTPTGKLPGTTFGYAGYRYDAETGTYHTRTRTYDPRLGRFLQTDPIGQQGGVNIYAYVTGDPINNADIAGTQPAGADDTTDEYGGDVPGTTPAPPTPPSFNPGTDNTGSSSSTSNSTPANPPLQGPTADPSQGINAPPPAATPSLVAPGAPPPPNAGPPVAGLPSDNGDLTPNIQDASLRGFFYGCLVACGILNGGNCSPG